MPKRNGWLDAEEQATWRLYLLVTQLIDASLDRQLQRDAGMPHGYYAILVALSEADNTTVRMSDLAANLRYSPSRLSHAVSAMEAKGWVKRTQCPADGRSQLAELRTAGRRALETAAPGHVAAVRRAMFDTLTDVQAQQLHGICAALYAGLSCTSAEQTTRG
jgi:DNA-binding MarR family transcriptional regulator